MDLRLNRRFAILMCAALLVCGAMVLSAGATAPSAGATAPSAATQPQDGLVNVRIGDITIRDVNVAVAAQLVVLLCDLVDVHNVAILVGQVDQTSQSRTFCRTQIGRVRVTQN